MLLRLLPLPAQDRPVAGTFLEQDLRGVARVGEPFVYTNFISSLDGRISLPEPLSGRRRVPPEIANAHDWQLYMELAAQADVLLTTGRHLRAVGAGRRLELLPTDEGGFARLSRWRLDRGLPARPAIAALSASLAIPAEIPAVYGGEVILLTDPAVAPARARHLEKAGAQVLRMETGSGVPAARAVAALAARGHRMIYSVAGPRVMTALLREGLLHRLYLTLAQVILGGEGFDTLTAGPPLAPPAHFRLAELYHDPAQPPGAGQLFAVYEASDQ